jgi:hypothetical protein
MEILEIGSPRDGCVVEAADQIFSRDNDSKSMHSPLSARIKVIA